MKTIIFGYPERQTSKHKKIIGEKQQPIDCQDCRGWPKGSLGAREDTMAALLAMGAASRVLTSP